MSQNNTRLTLRINNEIKQSAQLKLEKYGLTLSDYVRMVVTKVANDDENNDLLNTHFNVKHLLGK